MKQLLAIEYAKLKKLQSLKILLLCYIFVIPLWMWFVDYFFHAFPAFAILFGGKDFFTFPYIWHLTAYCASFFNILMCVSIVIITCNEIHFKTMRQNVIDGLAKKEVILSKFLVVMLFSIIVSVYTFLVGMLFGGIFSGFGNMYDGIDTIFRYFLQTIGYFSFAFLFALILRKPALAIILFIVYFPVEFISGFFVPPSVYQFFPLKSFADMTPLPFSGALLAQAEKDTHQSIWLMPMEWHYILAIAYIALFFGLSYFILKKRDL